MAATLGLLSIYCADFVLLCFSVFVLTLPFAWKMIQLSAASFLLVFVCLFVFMLYEKQKQREKNGDRNLLPTVLLSKYPEQLDLIKSKSEAWNSIQISRVGDRALAAWHITCYAQRCTLSGSCSQQQSQDSNPRTLTWHGCVVPGFNLWTKCSALSPILFESHSSLYVIFGLL